MSEKSCASCTYSTRNSSPDISCIICMKCSRCSNWELKLITDQFNEDYSEANKKQEGV